MILYTYMYTCNSTLCIITFTTYLSVIIIIITSSAVIVLQCMINKNQTYYWHVPVRKNTQTPIAITSEP